MDFIKMKKDLKRYISFLLFIILIGVMTERGFASNEQTGSILSETQGSGWSLDYEQHKEARGEEYQIQKKQEGLPQEAVQGGSERIDELIAQMSLEEKVAQLFMVTPETLTGIWGVTAAGPQTEAAFSEIPVGGVIYMGDNVQSWEQTREMLSSMQRISMDRIGLPVFLAVDEEGGQVRRVSGRLDQVPYIPDMASVGSTYDLEYAYDIGGTIGSYLSQLGFNVDLAPVADLLTNPLNTVIGTRSLGSDPIIAGEMVARIVDGLHSYGICATLKHFPGHGDTSEDSHSGLAVSYKSLAELENCEFLPFESGIQEGADFVMTGHIALPNVTGDYTPATLSLTILTDILRNRLGFEGIIITDALEMGAITNIYSSSEAAVYAIRAGADILLEPADFHSAYYAVLGAVQDGQISEERLNASLERILWVKLKMMGETEDISTGNQDKDNEHSGGHLTPSAGRESEGDAGLSGGHLVNQTVPVEDYEIGDPEGLIAE